MGIDSGPLLKGLDFRLELEVTSEANLLFKVIDERYKQNTSLLFTTNVEELPSNSYYPITVPHIKSCF